MESPGPGEQTEARPSRWRVALRRVSRLLLLVGIAAVIIYTLQHRPVTVEVVYELGSARRGLVAARMVYLAADGEEVRRVSFDYARGAPGVAQHHSVELLRGDYQVALELSYPAGQVPPALARARREPASGSLEKVQLRRPLHVRGKGTAIIYVVGS